MARFPKCQEHLEHMSSFPLWKSQRNFNRILLSCSTKTSTGYFLPISVIKKNKAHSWRPKELLIPWNGVGNDPPGDGCCVVLERSRGRRNPNTQIQWYFSSSPGEKFPFVPNLRIAFNVCVCSCKHSTSAFHIPKISLGHWGPCIIYYQNLRVADFFWFRCGWKKKTAEPRNKPKHHQR